MNLSRFLLIALITLPSSVFANAGAEPTEAEMRKAAIIKMHADLLKQNGGMHVDVSSQVKEFKKIGCEKYVGGPGYLCSMEFLMSMMGNSHRKKTAARFIRDHDGWEAVDP